MCFVHIYCQIGKMKDKFGRGISVTEELCLLSLLRSKLVVPLTFLPACEKARVASALVSAELELHLHPSDKDVSVFTSSPNFCSSAAAREQVCLPPRKMARDQRRVAWQRWGNRNAAV